MAWAACARLEAGSVICVPSPFALIVVWVTADAMPSCGRRRSGARCGSRYARAAPPDLVAHEMLRDTFWPVCSPALLGPGGPPACPSDLLRHPLVHMHWQPSEPDPPTWRHWLRAARRRDPRLADVPEAHGLAFREELHAIEAVAGGQGVGICSDVLVADELRTGALVKAYDLPLPGFGFYVAHLPVHPRLAAIEVFSAWVRSVARR